MKKISRRKFLKVSGAMAAAGALAACGGSGASTPAASGAASTSTCLLYTSQFSRETDKIVSYAQRNFTKLAKFGSCADVNFLLRLACNENAVYRDR